MTGNVSLTFAGSGVGTCTIPAITDNVIRVPNFTIKGLRGATFQVTATSTGQKITRIGATSFTFENAGINRTFTTASGKVVVNVTTSTSSPLGMTLAMSGVRNGRSVSGGGITVVDNLTSLSCTMTPNSVVWTASCNCPTSGSLSTVGCSDSEPMTVTFGGACGEVTVTKGSTVKAVTMDRCQP